MFRASRALEVAVRRGSTALVFYVALAVALGAGKTISKDARLQPTEIKDAAAATSVALCNPKRHEMRIIDEAATGLPYVRSIEAVNDPHFRSFIISVKNHVLNKFATAKPCPDQLDKVPNIELVFVRLPLVTSGNEPIAPPPSVGEPESEPTCRIDSPWMKLTIERPVAPLVRGVFIWNERQFLLDQAVVAGARNVPDVPPEPLTRSEFERLAQAYADAEILNLPEAMTQPVEDRIPPDLLWLFRHAWQSTRGPFANTASGAMRAALERGAENYVKLVVALVDRCFDADSQRLEYETVLDVADIISLEQYRVDRLY